MKKNLNVVSKKLNIKQNEDPAKEVAPEVIAQAIVDIAKAMKVFSSSRLKMKTIITLIHAESKVPKRDIEIVLNNLEAFEIIWLKK